MLAKLMKKIIGEQNLQRKAMQEECMLCGHMETYLINTKVHSDFNIKMIPEHIRSPFLTHNDGICTNCGLYQAYNRFSHAQLNEVNQLGKDILTSEEAYHTYPIPNDFVKDFHERTYSVEIPLWKNVFSELGLSPKRALFLRYWFGASAKFVMEEYNADIFGLDMSHVCELYVRDNLPQLNVLQGEINGHLEGAFLNSGPYEAIFTSHILVHSNYLRDTFEKLRSLLAPGGFLSISAETKFAPSNPFHKVYISQHNMVTLLEEYFDDVFLLDEVGIIKDNRKNQHKDGLYEYLAIVNK